ncbi:MAG: Sec-independent protein translocase protein TatB [Pseudomonadota bacterium]
MFDVGFAELLLIAIVGLLVIGPERLPGAIRTGQAWYSRIKRSLTDIKHEVSRELHNDAVLQDIKNAGHDLKSQADEFGEQLRSATTVISESEQDIPDHSEDQRRLTEKRAQ